MDERRMWTRRKLLASGAVGATAGLAGCAGQLSNRNQSEGDGTKTTTAKGSKLTLADFRGSGPMVESRPAPGGTSIEELPDLEGTLNVYLGGGEGGLYGNLIELLERKYPKFNVRPKRASSTQLANLIIEEMKGGQSPADVFWSIDSTSLGLVADAGVTKPLPKRVVKPVPKGFRADDRSWVGVAGRARSVPYNTDHFSASDIPNDIHAFTQDSGLKGTMGWAPSYGAFKSFVTAMRLLDGPKKTKQWLRGMQQQNVTKYPDEFLVSNAVADGEIKAGFANHYYAIRVMASRPDAPIDLAFTKNDAGALVNVSGAEIIKGTKKQELAANFIRHLLSSEAQEFFATTTFAYPTVPEVPPVGPLPTVDELAPPKVDLSKLSNLEPTLELMREVGVL